MVAGLEAITTGKSQRVSLLAKNAAGVENPVVTFDCSLKEIHSRKSPATKFQIENGQTVSDHITVEPFSLKLTGLITDTPLSLITELITTAASALLPSAAVLGKFAGALALAPALGPSSTSSPSAAAYLQILNIQAMKTPVSVFTSLYVYKNMWIENVSVPRDAKTGKVLLFDLDLTELLLVSPQSVTLTQFAAPDVSSGQGNNGKTEPGASSGYINGNTTGLSTLPPPPGFQ